VEDGYELVVFRIPGQGKSLMNQCGDSPGLKLAKAGFDVWFGNFRGNHISRKHKVWTQDDAEYWGFSLEELVMYDFKSMLKLVWAKKQGATDERYRV
jgi:hypothetical protein